MSNLENLIKNESVKIINYYPDNFSELEKNEEQTFKMAWDSRLMSNPILGAMFSNMVAKQFKNTVTKMLQDEKLHKELSSRNFDAVLVETFEISGFYLAEILRVPAIAMLSAVRYPIFDELFGQNSTLGYIPQKGSSLPPESGFLDRLNDVYNSFFLSIGQKSLNNAQYKIIKEALGGKATNWKDIVQKSPVFFVNSNPLLGFAVPRPGSVVQIGGITMLKEKGKNLPEEYEKILNERESTVFISFGSVVRAYEMPESYKKGLLEMFHLLPDVTFIFKYENEMENIPKNVHLKKWVPQPALLQDDRLKVFVTHGGLGSTMEVAYSGKPTLMIPLFADQFENAQMLARHGGAIDYDKFDLPNGKKLAKTLKEMISNQKYQQNARELQKVLLNQPINPKENFLQHLEFACKFPSWQSQIPAISRSGLISYYYLDVIFFLIATPLTVIGAFTYFMIRIFS
uniref:glucuronosyltransferase n=1 Tax=Caenorhabditis tropicalis TaxID=1561998 RepID=A0A1I7V1T0_9PELO